ncbi:amino acid adenylation domain-containing protein [Hansschlegelia sp. KR7-227]|uniref:amino acid adenylation domain-containing protein n=1 Tax=Hansschlegelia sp. KR7-227 TaxID=3400914 RepID=UPI003C042D31
MPNSRSAFADVAPGLLAVLTDRRSPIDDVRALNAGGAALIDELRGAAPSVFDGRLETGDGLLRTLLIAVEVDAWDEVAASADVRAGAGVFVAAPRVAGEGGAAAALLAFAERGLLPDGADRAASGAPLAAYLLTPRAFRIRLAREGDLAALRRLEDACWLPGLRTSARQLRDRLERCPGGQHVLEHDGGVAGVVYSQRVGAPPGKGVTAAEAHKLHDPAGSIIQLLALNVAPELQDRGFGDHLLEFALERSAVTPGVEQVVGVTRCKDAGKRPDLPPAAYVELRNDQGRRSDPVLRMHELHGAEVVGLVEGYRPKDAVNGGAGVLVRYDLKRRRRNELAAERPARDGGRPADAGRFVRETVAAILGRADADEVPPTAPLFELGLDSTDLLDLNERLRVAFGVALEPAFFFEHNNCARIADYLDRDVGVRPVDVAPIEPSSAADAVRAEDVAIVGVACLLPGGVKRPRDFWRLLIEGRQAVAGLPEGRWTWPDGFDLSAHPGVDRGGFLDDVAGFDAAFFRISPREAAGMDPQQRLLLQTSWACFEDAGWRPSALAGADTGVFVGASGSDYHLRLCERPLADVEGHFALGSSMAVLANRLSYFFDFDGPSLQIDTACSSSLVALHEAVAALRAGTCGRALVAGVNVLCHPANSIAFHRAGMLSKDGRCKTFDAAANGYVRGEGVVALLLKPLAAALADGDRVQAVIKGVATNHGGLAAGLTVPNPAKQADLVRRALSSAEVAADTITYVEAHGTGTALGDPIEMRGLKEAFGPGRTTPVCAIGSVKTNIGHLEAAAGLAGLLKVVLALQAKTIPASLNFETLNPHLSFEGSPFRVATEAAPWPRPAGAPRRAGVSSFGSGGSNAHVILEEAPEIAKGSVPLDGPVVAPLSARSEERLLAGAADLLDALEGDTGDLDLADVAHTLQTGREAFAARAAIVAGSLDELRAALRRLLAGDPAPNVFLGAGKSEQGSELAGQAAEAARAGHVDELARLWAEGADVEWSSLWGDLRPRRVALPTYPFAADRHWLADGDASDDAPLATAATADLFSRVRAHVAAVLDMPAATLEPAVALRSYGLDSIGGLKLQQRLEDDLEVALTGLDILESADLATLSTHVAALLERAALTGVNDAPAQASSGPEAADELRPLSEGQRGVWALQAATPEMAAYNLPFGLRFKGAIDAARFERAIAAAVARHPVVGERIVETPDGPRRAAGASLPRPEREDARALTESELRGRLRALSRRPFRLDAAAPIRTHLLDRDDETIVLIVIHHIAFDAGSIGPFLTALLDAYLDGEGEGRIGRASGYDAFVAWEADFLAGPAGDRARRHFAARLAGAPAALDLPVDRPRAGARRFAGETVSLAASGDASRTVERFCRSEGVTPASLFLAAFASALGRHAETGDQVVGVTAAVRRKAEFEPLVGFFVNMVPVRLRIDEGLSWADATRAVQRALVEDLDHAAYPFAALVRELGAERSAERAPIFQVAFNYQNYFGGDGFGALEERYAGRLPFSFMTELRQEGEYEIELEVTEARDSFALHLKYDPDLFDRASAERLVGHVLTLTERATEAPSQALRATSMLSATEEEQMLRSWTATAAAELAADRPVHEHVATQAARTPHAVALAFGEHALTYAELEDRADRLARRLVAAGVAQGDRVGVALRRSLDLPLALLAVLKAGAAYVPLEPELPVERLAHMVDDSGLWLIVTQSALLGRLVEAAPQDVRRLALDVETGAEGERENADRALPTVAADRLAYVIYTSGSTGRPKGVMIGHRAFASALLALARTPGLAGGDRLFAVTTYGFDIAGFELLGPLLVGATCVICAGEIVQDADRLRAAVESARPTLLQATPALWDMLFESGWRPQPGMRLLCGGEPLPEGLRGRFEACGGEAWNLYGPTEATIWATAQRVARGEPRGVGRPLANTRVHIVDALMRPTPIGVAGELCIAGAGLAEGYLNRPELTAERFVANPFAPGERLYRTGDRARWLPDGSIDLLGRADGQIKLRGHRIELGDIEVNLAEHPAVREAVVVLERAGERGRLAAYYLAAGGERADEAALRAHLKARLPGYMIPLRMERLSAFPLTANGKVDRAALAARTATPDAPSAESDGAPSATELEARVAAIWRDALSLQRLDRRDGFFDVGGDSVVAVSVARRISEAVGKPFSVTELFRHPTVAAIAAHLAPEPARAAAPAPQARASAPIPADAPAGFAIVGASCHFPGADGVDRFWDNLLAGHDAVRRPSADELLAGGASEAAVCDPRFVSAQATIDGKELFDAGFFRVAPRDAERMHPQLRLLLAHAWSAVEDAGYAVGDVADTAVYMTASSTPYGGETPPTLPPDAARVLSKFGPYQDWLLAQPGTIPTIVSHRLGLKGPSCFVHSNCSSSLVALDLACQALARGEARQALIGAASLLPQWSSGYVHQEGLNFAADGRVKAFDAAADGMIGGEGVAVVMLKRLADALRDGDHVYAVVRGVSVANDGADKAGFYAPSVRGQAETIARALAAAGVGAETIAYVETHGTGTALGDPIEFAALDEVFRANGRAPAGSCGLGSAKSGVGHLDAAAGLAGLIKTALALKHGTLPPTLHFNTINPKIALDGSPFYIVDAPRPLPSDRPVRAAVSSFGIGGTNAHAVLERTPALPERPAAQTSAELFPLSAKDRAALARRAADLLAAIERLDEADLADVAFTLQAGREPMEARVAIVAAGKAELADRLGRWLAGEAAVESVHGGLADAKASSVTWFAADEDFAATVERWLANRRLAQLAALWTQGYALDWTRLSRARPPRRLRLPTYPFAREAFWIRSEEQAQPAARGATHLHPLLHENVSTIWKQSFASRFSGREFFLADHVVQGAPVMPGVAHLEMARAAAARSFEAGDAAIRLTGVTWLRPLAVERDTAVVVEFEPEDGGAAIWEIREAAPDANDEAVPFSRGRAEVVEPEEPPVIDLLALRSACGGTIEAEACYGRFVELGFAYGPAQRALGGLAAGVSQDGGRFVLAEVSLPSAAGAGGFVLHPSVMDAMLQTRIGFDRALMGQGGDASASMPFAIEELRVYSPTPPRGVVWTRSVGGSGADGLERLDIDLADEDGRVCVAIRGFASRPIARPAPAETLLARPVWAEAPPLETELAVERRLVVLCGPEPRTRAVDATLSQTVPELGRVIVADGPQGPAALYRAAAADLLIDLKALAAERPETDLLVQLAILGEGDEALFEGLSSLLATASLEHPRILGQTIRFADGASTEEIVSVLGAEAGAPRDARIRREAGSRRVHRWEETPSPAEAAPSPWRDRGIYLITGGFGGLGLLFAEDIARRAAGATLILAGRSAPDAEAQRRIADVEALGARVVRRSLDVADAAAVAGLVAEASAEIGRLSGVLHAAGVLRDGLMARKSALELERVLLPKTDGTVNLDVATAGEPLDLFVLFASGSGALGNVGQADYAAANGFLDAFAAHRNRLVAAGRRAGRTIAIDWPLWAEGGMTVDAAAERIRQARGLAPLTTADGLKAFDAAVASGDDQMLVVCGDPARLRADLFGVRPLPAAEHREDRPAEAAPPLAPASSSQPPAPDLLRDETAVLLKRLLAAVVKLPAARIETDAELERYGIDSVMAIELVTTLEASFGPLSKTLLFERRSVRELTDYFIASHRDRLVELVGGQATSSGVATTPSLAVVAAKAAPERRPRSAPAPRRAPRAGPAPLDVAIIGLAGRYPKARNVDEFWANLRDGQDCITEIPGERWDHSRYFDPDKARRDTTYSKWGGFIDGVDECDPLFFGISPREMEAIDPQERLFLQCAYEAIEDAGYSRESLAPARGQSANVGVYVGVMYAEYQLFGAQAQSRGVPLTLTGSPASIANRVSYFFDFTGPSIAVDTMCSSSLTAIHLACRDLGEGCDYAVAGGVNVSVHPNKYLFLGQHGFVSSQGRCASFGEGGDGYVPGEGVGAVLLKPLSRAVLDGDRIYGVIRGTAVNHGGKTNGYTVPNPRAQGRVIERALRSAGVDARDVSYVEAHGTGTSLGDPIEISGLSRAFEAFTADRGFCAIGSAKSNIGHCESAAGIAGLTKVLLQMRHGELAPSLHAETLNPHIDFSATPFVVQRERAPWRRRTADGGRELPRLAGVSSFGAGGSNAHVVIEDYVAPARPAVASGPQVLVLSGRTEERLRARADALVAALGGEELAGAPLADVAYTLQVGREALEARLALIASSVAEARARLGAWLGGGDVAELWRGEGRREREGDLSLLGEEDLAGVVERWLSRGQLGRLAEAWTKGVTIDWTRLHAHKPHRVQLPTYPFERRRLWPEEAHDGLVASGQPRLHPLVHQNVSDLYGQRFRSRFTGDEPFLAGHVVEGARVLPGVAHLVMAQFAAATAARVDGGLRLRDVVWARPVVAGAGGVDLLVEIEAGDEVDLLWSIRNPGAEGEAALHSQGRAEILADQPDRIDLAELRDRPWRELSVAQAYQRFAARGLAYGPGMRGLTRLAVLGDGAGRQVIAEIAAPAGVTPSEPAILDAALQATLALDPTIDIETTEGTSALLPFALKEAAIFGPLPEQATVFARYADGASPSDPVVQVDLDVIDASGVVQFALRGLAGRSRTARADALAEDGTGPGTVLLSPVWEPVEPQTEQAWPDDSTETVAIIGDGPLADAFARALPRARRLVVEPVTSVEALTERLREFGPVDHLVWLPADRASDGTPDERLVLGQEEGSVLGFRLAKALMALGYGGRSLGWTTGTVQAAPTRAGEPIDPTHASVHGFLGSIAKELSPAWRMRVVDLPRDEAPPIEQILRLPADRGGEALAWRDGGWLRRALLPTRFAPHARPPYRDGGVYVVLGGAGGIGEAWTEHVVRRHGAKVAWIGRRSEDDAIRAKIARIGRLGPAPIYLQADARDREALEAARDAILAAFGPIAGVIHSALVLKDASLARMDEESFRAALAAKVDSSVNIAAVFGRGGLDAITFFSSMMSFAKTAGQSNYAAGCAFADAFAHAFALRTGVPAKVMNWGWWGSVGIVATESNRERMARFGLGSVEPDEGMAALEVLLAGPASQVAFLKTTRPLTRDQDGVGDDALHALPQETPSVIAGLKPFGGVFHG